jgi:hypothetical protein
MLPSSKTASMPSKMVLCQSWRHFLSAKTLTAGIVACALGCAIGNPSGAVVDAGLHAAAGSKTVSVAVVPQKRAPVLLPLVDHDDILPKHRLLADSTFRALPSLCRNTLKTFYVLYKNPANRGLAGETEMFIAGNVTDAEFRALITHECGHIIDLGYLRGTAASGASEFYDGGKVIYADDPSVEFYRLSWNSAKIARDDATHSDFVSGYAEHDAFEDFSETFAFYIFQKKEFDRLATKNPVLRAKRNYMAALVQNQPQIAVGSFVRSTKQPWDVTRLPYVWVGEKPAKVATTAVHASN